MSKFLAVGFLAGMVISLLVINLFSILPASTVIYVTKNSPFYDVRSGSLTFFQTFISFFFGCLGALIGLLLYKISHHFKKEPAPNS